MKRKKKKAVSPSREMSKASFRLLQQAALYSGKSKDRRG
jgi:hypothetical protein